MANTQEKTIVLRAEQSDPETVAMAIKHAARFDGIAIGLGSLAFIALIAFIIKGISPFLISAALFLVLFPFREYRTSRTIMFAAGIVLGFWLFVTLASLLFPFIIGLLIAYLFNPVVTWMKLKWNISRGWSSLFIVLVLCAIVFFLGWLLVPLIIDQLQALLTTISNYFKGSTFTLDEQGIRNFFLSLGFPQKYVNDYVSGEIIPQLKDLYAALPKIIVTILSA